MLNLAVLGSTSGSDLDSIIQAIKSGRLKAKISVVISNKKEEFILERAKQHNVKAVFVDSSGKSREDFDKEVMKIIDKKKIGLVLLIGYMKLLSNEFVAKYKNKIMNVHPSLLPAFAAGMDKNVHRQVLENGVKVTGCTVHFVDEGADTGPIILQKAVSVEEDDTVDTLKAKVQKAEQEILPAVIDLFARGKLKVEGRKVRILK